MIKIKTLAIITAILGIISLIWVIYDYIALTDLAYNYGQEAILLEKKRNITMGFIPVLLFHFFFFATVYLLFDYLKQQKSERLQLEMELEKQKKISEDIRAGKPGSSSSSSEEGKSVNI